MTETSKLRWGILGPGSIARDFFAGSLDSATGIVTAVGARKPDSDKLTKHFPGTRIIEGYDALISDPEIDAIYIATPHPFHAEWAIKAAQKGKHVLCEKPLSLTAAEAEAMLTAARRAGTFMGEAYMYRLHPLVIRLLDLLKSGVIGDVRLIKSSFGFAMPSVMPEHRLFASSLAGGGILDVGGYPVSMVRLIAGLHEPTGLLNPDKVAGTGHIGSTGVDEYASAVLHFPNGIVAEVSCSITVQQDNVLRIFGTKGHIELKDFWFAGGKPGGTATIHIVPKEGAAKTVDVVSNRHLYSFEIDAVAAAVRSGKQEFAWPGMSWADTIDNLSVMDKWRAGLNLQFLPEKPENRPRTLGGEKLAVKANRIPHTRIKGLEKDISCVALGFLELPNYAATEILLDTFFENGGNLFDTAHMYGGGVPEKHLGNWMKTRGVRDQLGIIAKGVHTPLCYPDVLAKQLHISLERMQTDHVDVYFMHRDNPDIPVGEFVDVMDAEYRAGRIRGPFGGSNWTRERMTEAMDYAEKNGKQKPAVLSNNFSLAVMHNPVWDGCIAAKDKEWQDWLIRHDITNFAWSSQARGFFTDRSGPNQLEDGELVHSWYSDENFARKQRATELAVKLGKDPIHVALAYCLAQDFSIIPLIGPRTAQELYHCFDTFDVVLSKADLAWLNGG
jgi:predicted dehydrogenase/aryl-alcohol dehydrogenase-like predicted oxidoreductase